MTHFYARAADAAADAAEAAAKVDDSAATEQRRIFLEIFDPQERAAGDG